MSTRKERRMKSAIDPLIKQVKDYVGQHSDELAALGIVGKIKFHTHVRTDKLKKEAQIIFTLAQSRMAKGVKEHRERVKQKEAGHQRPVIETESVGSGAGGQAPSPV